MREIKFRAWWNDTGKKVEDFNNEYIIDACNDEVFTVEQFTGLHDKNGKEIFDGDICRIKFDIAKVEDYIYNSLTKKELEDGERVFLVESPMFNNQPELNADVIDIIGNIHENPELLND